MTTFFKVLHVAVALVYVAITGVCAYLFFLDGRPVIGVLLCLGFVLSCHALKMRIVLLANRRKQIEFK